MNPRPLTPVLFFALAGLLPAQTHSGSDLVLGQRVTFAVDGAPPQATILYGWTAAGLGTGTCLPPPFGFCLGILDPVLWFPARVTDSSGTERTTFVLPANLPEVPIASQALVASLAGGNLVIDASNAIERTIRPLSSFSDTFDGTQLDPSWQIHNPDLLIHSVSGGELHLRPTQAGPPVSWFADGEGPLVYKLVTGNFDVRATVRTYDPGQPTQPPGLSYRLGGITVRDPASTAGDRDWLHITVGSGTAQTPIAVEDKSTTDSQSTLQLYPLSAARAEIRVTRLGATFAFYYRENATDPWTALRSFVRPDLPGTMQVGLQVSSWTSPASVQSSFAEITFLGL